MTDYPSIKPEDVREGDVVRGDWLTVHGKYVPVQGEAWMTSHAGPAIGDTFVSDLTDLRLVSRPTPPEPPLRVGDWLEDVTGEPVQLRSGAGLDFANRRNLTRIEPPVGWPVGVPTEDGGTRWYVRYGTGGDYYEQEPVEPRRMKWPDLIATGGVPAPAVTR